MSPNITERKNYVENDSKSSRSDFINYVIAAILFLAIGVLLAVMLDKNNVSESEMRTLLQEMTVNEAQVRAIVSDVMSDSITAAMANAGAPTVPTPAPTPVPLTQDEMVTLADDDPYWGSEDAPVIIVEFSDFFCPYCGRHAQQTIPQIQDKYGDYVRYVYRDYPGVGGERAFVVANASECAHDQDQYWEYHTLLFDNQSALSPLAGDSLRELLIGYAQQLELDTETFTTCLDEDTHRDEITADRAAAMANGVSGTPTFFINGTRLVGAQPFESFARIIDQELAKLGIEVEGS